MCQETGNPVSAPRTHPPLREHPLCSQRGRDDPPSPLHQGHPQSPEVFYRVFCLKGLKGTEAVGGEGGRIAKGTMIGGRDSSGTVPPGPWALGQGSVSNIFPWEITGLDTGLHSLPRPGRGRWRSSLPISDMKKPRPWFTAVMSFLGGLRPASSLPPCRSPSPLRTPSRAEEPL